MPCDFSILVIIRKTTISFSFPFSFSSVWHRLKAENQAFFKNYYTILALSQQIEQYNALLEKQRQLMVSEQTIAASLPISNGFHHHAVPSLPNSNGSHLHASKFLLIFSHLNATLI